MRKSKTTQSGKWKKSSKTSDREKKRRENLRKQEREGHAHRIWASGGQAAEPDPVYGGQPRDRARTPFRPGSLAGIAAESMGKAPKSSDERRRELERSPEMRDIIDRQVKKILGDRADELAVRAGFTLPKSKKRKKAE